MSPKLIKPKSYTSKNLATPLGKSLSKTLDQPFSTIRRPKKIEESVDSDFSGSSLTPVKDKLGFPIKL